MRKGLASAVSGSSMCCLGEEMRGATVALSFLHRCPQTDSQLCHSQFPVDQNCDSTFVPSGNSVDAQSFKCKHHVRLIHLRYHTFSITFGARRRAECGDTAYSHCSFAFATGAGDSDWTVPSASTLVNPLSTTKCCPVRNFDPSIH